MVARAAEIAEFSKTDEIAERSNIVKSGIVKLLKTLNKYI